MLRTSPSPAYTVCHRAGQWPHDRDTTYVRSPCLARVPQLVGMRKDVDRPLAFVGLGFGVSDDAHACVHAVRQLRRGASGRGERGDPRRRVADLYEVIGRRRRAAGRVDFRRHGLAAREALLHAADGWCVSESVSVRLLGSHSIHVAHHGRPAR
jgi:hypothetical protein